MDLDTNAKKFKYSNACKILCVVLCLITIICAAGIGSITAFSVYFNTGGKFDKQADNGWTNTFVFYYELLNDANTLSNQITRQFDIDDVNKMLMSKKDSIVDEAYSEVLALKSQAEAETDYYDGIVDEYSGTYEVVIDDNFYGNIDISYNSTREDIEKQFDQNAASWAENYLGEYCGDVNDSINYYAKLENDTQTNVKNFDEKRAYASDYYFISKQGKLESRGIELSVCESVYNSLAADSSYFKNADFYIYFNNADLTAQSIVQLIFEADNTYSQLYCFMTKTQGCFNHSVALFSVAIMLIILSFAFAFAYFSVTGKANRDDFAKLRFYDYIPFELAIAIAGGLGALSFMLLSFGEYEIITVIAICFAVFLICWFLLFMLCSSTARFIGSGKKFYKHLLTYWIFYSAYRLLKKAKQSFKRLYNATLYKPKKFSRNVILCACLWMIGNVVLIGLTLIAIILMFDTLYYSDGVTFICFVAAVFFALLLIIGNILVLVKVSDYIQNLDKIIIESSQHEELTIRTENLDASLQALAEGICYTNAELQSAIEKAVKDERLRTELITNVSHDLKTPLTSIITYVDLLSKCDIEDEKAKKYIKVLDEKGGKLKRLIDDLIEASKVTSGNVTVTLAPMNLQELCLQSTVDAQSDFEKAGLELIVKQGDKALVVVADGAKTNRVIENLLSNARKYSARSSRVYVSVYQEGAYGVFEIKNISAQALDITPDELTERFVRGDKSRNCDGNGLGLSIAKELCNLQKGSLEVSIDGDLFKVRVKLPICS